MDVAATRQDMGVTEGSTGTFTGDGTALSVLLGYRPKMVVLVNLTDATKIEKIDGMTDAQSLQTVTAGTQTVQTSSQIVLTERGFTATAAVNASGKSFAFYAC